MRESESIRWRKGSKGIVRASKGEREGERERKRKIERKVEG